MDLVDWQSKWEDGKIAFHQSEIAPFLVKYCEDVWGSENFGRILVPLCGKSLDMVFLAERSHVIGVEYVEQAVVDFFKERKIDPIVNKNPHLNYAADNYQIYVEDFFEITATDTGHLDGVFDRAALVDINPQERKRYVDKLTELMPKDSKLLLLVFEYDQDEMNGPPFPVLDEDVHRLFDENFNVIQLDSRECLDADFKSRGITSIAEVAYMITRK